MIVQVKRSILHLVHYRTWSWPILEQVMTGASAWLEKYLNFQAQLILSYYDLILRFSGPPKLLPWSVSKEKLLSPHVLCAKLLFISFAFDLSPNDEINLQRRCSCTGDCKLGPKFHQLGPPLVFLVGWTLRVLLVMLIILVTEYKHHLYPFCLFKDLIS